MVRVVDSIMGSGKTQATISYFNQNKDKLFIYITPYLDEAARIVNGCPDLNFIEPVKGIKKYGYTKTGHITHLIEQKKNIASTHQAFKRYSKETLNKIREYGYTLVIDEAVDTVEEAQEVAKGDIDVLVKAGYISVDDNNVCTRGEQKYKDGEAFKEIFTLLQSRHLIRVPQKNSDKTYYWTVPADLITAFQDVIVLTYLFKGQHLCHFFNIHGIEYTNLYVKLDSDGNYSFTENAEERNIPQYVYSLKDTIHICKDKKLNKIGQDYHDLSVTWFDTHPEKVRVLHSNLRSYFQYHHSESDSKDLLWSTYKDFEPKLKRKGYMKSCIALNAKATNEYRNRSVLAYCVNLFIPTPIRMFYRLYGIELDNDAYALSTMVQWIWRSAIRDGKEVYLYLPSRRMREILETWIDETQRTAKERNN